MAPFSPLHLEVDAHGRVAALSEALGRKLGPRPDEMIGEPVAAHLAAPSRGVLRLLQAARWRTAPAWCTLWLQTIQGPKRFLACLRPLPSTQHVQIELRPGGDEDALPAARRIC